MRTLLGLFVLLCSALSQDSSQCPFQYLRPWLCNRDYSCNLHREETVTLVCKVRINGPNSTYSIRWFRSDTSDREADRTFDNGTSETTVRHGDRRQIESQITVLRSAGYWWCGVMENEELLVCPEMPTVHIFQCSCKGRPAKCPPSIETCNITSSRAHCSPSTTDDSFCLVNSVIEQTLPRSSESISDTKPVLNVKTRTPTFQSPRTSNSMSETKTTISLTTRMFTFQTPSTRSTPDTALKDGDDTAFLKLLPVIAPVAGVTVALFGIVLVIICIACLVRNKGVKHHNGSTDTEEHIYDTVKMDTLIRATTGDQRYNPTPFSSANTAADYEVPITSLKVAGNRRPQMGSVNPVCLEVYGSSEDGTLNDQAKNDS